jgi:HAD superfamily hydrolase (TIGR01509 family)
MPMSESASATRFPFCKANAIRALILDCDGVLLNSGRAYYTAYERVLNEAGIRTTPREIYLLEGRPTGQVLSTIFAQRNMPFTESLIKDLVDRRRIYQSEIGSNFFPGIWNLLADFRAESYKTAVVTGSSRRSIQLVITPDLEHYFDAVITADDVTHPKPHPEPFLLAAEKLRIPASNCLVVENAPFGIQSAKAAGCPTIGICTTLPAEDLKGADWIVTDHRDLASLLYSESKNCFIVSAPQNHGHD